MAEKTTTVDQTALKFNQACIIILLLIGYLLDLPWLVAFVGGVMLVGTIWPASGLFKLCYARLLRPAGILQARMMADEPEPHLFAQGLGGIFLAIGVVMFLLGAPVVGWLLAGVVVALAAVNLLFGFCLGCFLYYRLARLGVRADLPWWRPVRMKR
jgi:hypothetical protein